MHGSSDSKFLSLHTAHQQAKHGTGQPWRGGAISQRASTVRKKKKRHLHHLLSQNSRFLGPGDFGVYKLITK